MRRLLLSALPVVALAALSAVFLSGVTKPDSTLNIYPDNESFLGPMMAFSSRALRAFDLPLWMNTTLGGIPLYNLPQLSPYYPFYFGVFDLFTTPIETIATLHRITLLHVVVLQATTYVLLRTLRLSRPASVIGVLFVVFNLTTREIMKWPNVFSSFSWSPLFIAGVVCVLEQPGTRTGVAMTVGAFVMMAYAMVGQPLILTAFLTASVVAGFVASRLLRPGPRVVAPMLHLGLTVVVAVSLALPVILPVTLALPHMIRWVSPTQTVVGNAPIPFEFFVTDQLALHEMVAMVLPTGRPHEITHPYIGVFPVVLALLGLFAWRRHWVVLTMGAIAVYSFGSSFGSHLGMAYVNYALPLVNKIREPSYFMVPLNMAVGILAAFGVDTLIDACRRQRHSESVTLTLAASWAGVVGLVVAAVGAQFTYARWTSPTFAHAEYLRLNVPELEVAFARLAELDPTHEYRLIFGAELDGQVGPMLASFYGIRGFSTMINPQPLKMFNEMYYHRARPAGDKYFRGLGAKFLLCRECRPEDVLGYERREQVGPYAIYVAREATPHVYTSTHVAGTFANVNDYTAKLSTHDLASLPVYFDATTPPPSGWQADTSASCLQRTERHELNHLEFAVSCSAPAVFVLNEFYTDAWSVSVNERPVTPHRVNGNQIGVMLTAGPQLVEFVYAPRELMWSVVGAGLGALLLVGLMAGSATREPRRALPPE